LELKKAREKMAVDMKTMEGGDWVYDCGDAVEWSMENVGNCGGCNEAEKEHVFAEGELKGCKSGFCKAVYCDGCRSGKYAGMQEEWEAYVLEHAVWLADLEEQDVEEDDEDYNAEYLAENLTDTVNCVDKKRPGNWCVSCYLACTVCAVEKCGARAVRKGECLKCGDVTRDLKRKRVECSVDKCVVEEVGAKKLRVTIDLTLE
jgi:hypothetical protein